VVLDGEALLGGGSVDTGGGGELDDEEEELDEDDELEEELELAAVEGAGSGQPIGIKLPSRKYMESPIPFSPMGAGGYAPPPAFSCSSIILPTVRATLS
jgi:hypothetical protein